MHVIASEHLDVSAAVVARDGEAVLVLREGLLSADDLDTLQRVCAVVDARSHSLEYLTV